jgi:hypothetical protein
MYVLFQPLSSANFACAVPSCCVVGPALKNLSPTALANSVDEAAVDSVSTPSFWPTRAAAMPRSKSSGTRRICAPCPIRSRATVAATAGSLLVSPSITLI